MAEKKTIWQKLTNVLNTEVNPMAIDKNSQDLISNDKEDNGGLITAKSQEEFDLKKLTAQQTAYLNDQYKVINKDIYQKSVYYETTRYGSYLDFESMEYCLHADTQIATPNGFITIKELADKGRDNEFITYAYDHNIKQVVPAKARNAHYTRDEMTYKVTFDDNSFIIGTWEHRLMKRDGSFTKISELKEGDSMMPFYRKSFFNNQNYNWVYTMNYSDKNNGWVSEHKLIAEWFNDTKLKKTEVVHHKNFKGKDNNPENLQIMDDSEHQAYHARLNNEKLWANPDYRAKMSEVAKRKGKYKWNGKRAGVNNPAYFHLPIASVIESAKTHIEIYKVAEVLNISVPKIQREIKKAGYSNWFNFLDNHNIKYFDGRRTSENSAGSKNSNFKYIPWDLLIDKAKEHKSITKTAESLNVSTVKMNNMIKGNGYGNWGVFLGAYGIELPKYSIYNRKELLDEPNKLNHKVVSIEPYGIVPVYDLTVPGYKNFATDTIFSHNTPEIGAAMDIMAEESTCLNDKGVMLEVRSNSDRVKNILEHLFNSILDINSNLYSWTRNTVKYGDDFVLLKSEPEKGITQAIQLKNFEIKRIDGDPITGEGETKFEWKVGNVEFNTWQIAHFRLLGDDKKMPYGTSALEKARKIWKMLCLAEDAMMVYRISRAPERRVFKIDVGSIDPDDVENYVQKVASKFKKTASVNQNNGQIDLRYNTLTQDEDYFIPVRNGQNATVIDTLPGAANLSDIGDLSFLHNKLFAALRVPKSFLGFEETAGDGKSLSMMDVRFGRTINRIQQAMIMELNKIAIIHLYLLGFEEEWNNFSLSLSNPSSQAEILKMEILGTKLDNFAKATTPIGNGPFSPMSQTRAKKDILGMSEDEIVLDLQQQRLELAEAYRNSPEVLPTKNLNSGIFDNLDKRYMDNGEATDNSMENPDGAQPDAGGGAPMPGGGGIPGGGQLPDLNEPVGGLESPAPGGLPNELPAGGPELKEMDFYLGNKTQLMESLKKNSDKVNKLIGE